MRKISAKRQKLDDSVVIPEDIFLAQRPGLVASMLTKARITFGDHGAAFI